MFIFIYVCVYCLKHMSKWHNTNKKKAKMFIVFQYCAVDGMMEFQMQDAFFKLKNILLSCHSNSEAYTNCFKLGWM